MATVSVVLHAPAWGPQHTTPCQAEPELFFPVSEDGPQSIAQIAKAKRLCRGCSRVADCLQDALDEGHDHGIWGGTTTAERRVIRRRRKTAGVTR
ncbi:WhiB family transcriptional regulator [Pseudonocardia dioxanivorans]|jgi:WhiB family transcriptional regulator, redox-sensing transcriptional regulator|uniref:Transcriptional regulator WhiB n=1 Tax=Pseudonocardia dioxanivorans (strain ATCC 55486 / DSM 44775 / JCM 13855 / CB1190) TaxID=675635 RepID=F2L786_PSEUX|nr:WhiB family transcriptional regulator [Pseudonocardia dioxanivorans]AEA29059.1 transcription factor WhiB [Pseudonocardia dioxanivorans CB1190]